MKVRRVVTGHDENGRAIVTSDALMDNVITMKSGHQGCLMWVTEETPCSVDGDDDPAQQVRGIAPPPLGSVLRILEVMPGKPAFMHRTDSIDYALVLEGECVMLLDEGEEVSLSAGDILIQRGTWHGWTNRSDKPCRLAFILIGAQAPAKHLHPD